MSVHITASTEGPPPRRPTPEDAIVAQVSAWCDEHPDVWATFDWDHPLFQFNYKRYELQYRHQEGERYHLWVRVKPNLKVEGAHGDTAKP